MPTLRLRALTSALLSLTVACGGDDGDASESTTNPTTSSTTIDPSGSSSSGDPSTTASSSGEGSTGVDPSTSEGPADSSSEGSATTGAPACDPVVPGEWNSCIDENGDIDNTLCMWMGTGMSVGMVSCLNASSMDGANTCFIRGCEDACDCFAPPATGTAEVICDAILANNEMGCGLDCSDGKICPDGMICADNLCFWPPV